MNSLNQFEYKYKIILYNEYYEYYEYNYIT